MRISPRSITRLHAVRRRTKVGGSSSRRRPGCLLLLVQLQSNQPNISNNRSIENDDDITSICEEDVETTGGVSTRASTWEQYKIIAETYLVERTWIYLSC
jgi:hypothetical protein